MFVKLSTGEIVNADHIQSVSPDDDGNTQFAWNTTEYDSRLMTATPGLADYHLFEAIAAWQASGGEKAA